MPFVEGSSPRIEKREDNQWHCIHCDYSNPQYQPVVGHLNLHKPGPRKPRIPKAAKQTDPLDLSITQLILRLEDAESQLIKAKAQLKTERQHTVDIRRALSAFMQVSDNS